MSRSEVSHIADILERAILSGEYATGEQLPSERDLSDQYKVSRSVIREALGRLTSLGLVQSQHGSGNRVAAPSSRVVTMGYQRLLSGPDFKLEHLAEVRLPLETTIAALAAMKRTVNHLAKLHQSQLMLGDRHGSLELHVVADRDFHATLAHATGNPLFLTVLDPIQQLLIESRRRTLGRHGAALAHEHHARILAAVEARNPTEASEAMRYHLETNFKHLLDEDSKVV